MKTTDTGTIRNVVRLLAIALVAILPANVLAEIQLTDNRMQEGDLSGTKESQAWIIDLKEDFNNLRFEVSSPAGPVVVKLRSSGSSEYIPLAAAKEKGTRRSGPAVVGSKIEAFPLERRILSKGRYQIQIAAQKPETHPAGRYSIRLLEPTLVNPTK